MFPDICNSLYLTVIQTLLSQILLIKNIFPEYDRKALILLKYWFRELCFCTGSADLLDAAPPPFDPCNVIKNLGNPLVSQN